MTDRDEAVSTSTDERAPEPENDVEEAVEQSAPEVQASTEQELSVDERLTTEPEETTAEPPADTDDEPGLPGIDEGAVAEAPTEVAEVAEELVTLTKAEDDEPIAADAVPADEAGEAVAVEEEPTEGAEPLATAPAEVSVTAEDGAAAEDAEEDAEDEEPNYMFQLGDWYVVHTYAGYENKVKANLASRIQSMNMEDKIYEVVVPTEEVMELKSGKMQSVQKKVFPGYILVRMSLDDDSWYVVRNTPGVTGFVGPTGAKPVPLDPQEAAAILQPKAEERPRPKLEFDMGEVVSVIGGPFNGYSGPVNGIDVEKQVVRVLLDLFGRETPVDLTFDQVTKL